MPRPSLSVRIATLGPLGKSPFAPGTIGTVVAGAPAAYFLSLAPGWLSIFLLVLVVSLGVYASEQAEGRWGATTRRSCHRRARGVPRHHDRSAFHCIVPSPGIAAFRIFDIWKPWPVNAIDARVKEDSGSYWMIWARALWRMLRSGLSLRSGSSRSGQVRSKGRPVGPFAVA